ncbi:hypothetical protein MHI04_06465 [Lysinibacillus sp. FSL K6-1151]|jgi:hypothetical protein
MKYKVLTILLCVMFVSGCMPKVLTFVGENENWEVQFEVTSDKMKSDQCGATSGTIRYIGDQPLPKEVNYTLKHGIETSGSDSLDKNGVILMGEGCSNALQDTEVEITIK